MITNLVLLPGKAFRDLDGNFIKIKTIYATFGSFPGREPMVFVVYEYCTNTGSTGIETNTLQAFNKNYPKGLIEVDEEVRGFVQESVARRKS